MSMLDTILRASPTPSPPARPPWRTSWSSPWATSSAPPRRSGCTRGRQGRRPARAPRRAHRIVIARGGSRCDPDSPDYDSTAPVLYYKDSTPQVPHPLTERRYDTLYKRIQLTLPWANEIMLPSHYLRKTGASIVERIAGSEVARLYLRHGRRKVTQTYTEASLRRLAEAVEVFTGRPHPSARPQG